MTGLKSSIEDTMEATYTTFTPLKYKTQVVSGTNWTIVYSTGADNLLEVKVW